VVSSNAPPDFGRFAGGVVNMTTKSGSNAFHGTGYEYLRNADFNANDFFSNQIHSARPKDNQNQYGVSVGGPIIKDRLFFNFTWEGFAGLFGDLVPTNVPTTATSRTTWGGSDMQDGIFANVTPTTANPTGQSIIDPLGNCHISTTVNPGFSTITNLGTGGCGNAFTAILKTYFPDPNQNPNTSTSNFELTTPLANHQNQYTGRLDYTLSTKQRLFARYTYWWLQDTAHTEFQQEGLNGTTWPTDDGHNGNVTHQVVLGDTYAFNPTTVFDLRANYVRETDPNLAASTSVNNAGIFGAASGGVYATLAPQFSAQTAPGFNATGGHGLYGLNNFPNTGTTRWDTYALDGSLIKIIGPHSLKVGAEIRLMDQSALSPNGAAGSYTFTANFSSSAYQSPNTIGIPGDEWASLLMGYTTGVSFKTTGETASYTYYQGYYASDTWRVSPSLTVNLGVRYELPGGISERNNKTTVLLPSLIDPYTGITGTEVLVDTSAYPHRPTVLQSLNLFAPRVGLSYRAGANTVIQGGWGISYLPNDIQGGIGGPINGATSSVSPQPGNVPTPLQTLFNDLVTPGYPGVAPAGGLIQPYGRTKPNFMTAYGCNSLACGGYLKQAVSASLPFQNFPYVQQWNIALNHQFTGNWVAGISYSGLKGTNLPGTHSMNQLPDSDFALGSALSAQTTLAQATQYCPSAVGLVGSVTNKFNFGQCLRPYPQYSGFTDSAADVARENYRSLQLKAQKRFGNHGQIAANFTTSKNMANTDTKSGFIEAASSVQNGTGSAAIQDNSNLAAEYSLISYDVTNRMIVNYILNLPFGKGQKYGNSLSGVGNELASGWAVNGITTVQSGFPTFIGTTGTSNQLGTYGGGTIRPNVVPGCNKKVAGSGLTRVNAGGWFNVTCFSYAGDSAFCNEPRVDPDLRSDGVKNFDLALKKATPIHESANLEFRTEFFNIFNRVQFAPPGAMAPVNASTPFITQGSLPANTLYGKVAYQTNKPRQIQLSLRLTF
jgi:hypothetical protein